MHPAVNGLQLVRIPVVIAEPRVGASVAGNTLTISWNGDAAGFTLQSSGALGAAANWTPVNGVANPITGAGSANVTLPAGAGTRYYRMVK